MSQNLYTQILAYVLEDVRRGALKPGDRVSSEHELAERFSVSRITSRRALELLSQHRVVERTRGRGTFVCEQLPNLEGVSLALGLSVSDDAVGGKARSFGLIIPDFSEVYGLELVYAIEEACSHRGHHLVLKRSQGEREREEAQLTALRAHGVDGLIVFPVHGEHYNPVLLRAVLEGFPVVLVDRILRGIPVPGVATDNRGAALELANHLLALGHREIAFLSPPVEHTSSIEDRLEGLREALRQRGLNLSPDRILSSFRSTLPKRFSEVNIQSDQLELAHFLDAHVQVTGFFVSEYNLALELRRLLETRGQRIPQDASIVCFDSPRDAFERPFFTHIRQNESALGRCAVELLLSKLRGESPALHTPIGFDLLEGRSSGPVKVNLVSSD